MLHKWANGKIPVNIFPLLEFSYGTTPDCPVIIKFYSEKIKLLLIIGHTARTFGIKNQHIQRTRSLGSTILFVLR